MLRDAFAFSLILARVVGAVSLLPGLGEAASPMMVRAGLAGGVSLLLLPGTQALMPAAPGTVAGFAAMVLASLVVGLWIGWMARAVVASLGMAGQWVAAMLGLANILAPDSLTGAAEPALGRLFDLLAPAVLLASGLYAIPLDALAESFSLIHPGAALPAGDGAVLVARQASRCFLIAFRLASPFVLASLGWQTAIGMVARLVPRMQIYFIGLPGQIIGGILLLFVVMQALLSVWTESMAADFSRLIGWM